MSQEQQGIEARHRFTERELDVADLLYAPAGAPWTGVVVA